MDKKVQAERYKCYGCYSLVFKKKEAYLRHLRQHLDIAVMPPVTSNDVELKRLKLKIDIQFNFPDLYDETEKETKMIKTDVETEKETKKIKTDVETEKETKKIKTDVETLKEEPQIKPELNQKVLRKSCEICQIEVDELVSHMEFVHSVKHYQDSDNEEELPESITCDECDEVFIKKCDLIRHRMKHIMINQKAIYVVNSNEKLAGNTKTVVGTIKKRNFDSMLADVYDVNTKKKMTIQTPTEKLILHTVPH